MRYFLYIITLSLLVPISIWGQRTPLERTPIQPRAITTERDSNDIPQPPFSRGDTNITDTINIPTDIKYAQDPLESEIEHFAEDSMHFNVANNTIYLFGNAYVKYQDFELTAAYIIFDQKNDLVIAEGMTDSLGNLVGIPEFKDGEQQFKAKKIKYNYKTGKGLISEVTTQQNDLYIHSGTLKYQKAQDDHDHDGHHHAEDVICSKNSLFTTCDHPHPHFGIRSNKQKIIADKVIVVGPSNLEIAGVTTPLWIPFGFFPMTKGKRSGLIFPRDYENSQELGFGLRNLGYYWALNDKVDFQVTGELYTRGTWRINSRMRYNVRYKYSGQFDLQYGWNYRSEIPGEIGRTVDKTLYVKWIFNQDRAANPNYTFKADVNFQINNAQQVNNNDFNSVFNNRIGSRIDFNKAFTGNKMRFTASIVQEQVTSNRDFKMDLPNLRFNVNRFFPFKKKVRSGDEKWFEKIGMTYSADAITRVKTKDTLLFTPAVFDDIDYGIRHKADLDASFRVFKHFNLSPNVNYSESYFFETIEKDYNTTISYKVDSIIDPVTNEFIRLDSTEISSSKTDTTFFNGFKPLRQLTASLSLNTEIFSTLRFKKGRLEGLRYTLRPRVGFSYTPDYTESGWGYVKTYDQNGRDVQYSVFEGNVFNENPSRNGMQMNLTYGFSNIFEVKYKNRKDTTNQSKIIRLFDRLDFGGNYNFAADSLNFSLVSGGATLRLFKKITTVSINMAFDPYIEDDEGRRINVTRWEAERKLLRFDFMSTNFRSNISWNNIKEWFGIEDRKRESPSSNVDGPPITSNSNSNNSLRGGGNVNYSENFISNISLSHNLNLRTDQDGTDITTHTLTLQGNINLSPKWNFNIRNIGYNFVRKSFIYPDISISRDLHCWQMGLSWQPERGTYSFYLRVNPGSLDFISVPWNKNQFDTGFGGRL